MLVQINGRQETLPTSLSEFTLGQKIAFQQEHGNDLDKMLKSILEMPDDVLREAELVQFSHEKMFRTVSFFMNESVESLKQSQFIDEIARLYYSSCAIILDQEQQIKLQQEIIWNDELWELSAPELTHSSKMTFGEFIDAKQMVSQMVKVGMSQWEYMLPLCAIYLRKKGEEYSPQFLHENSERLELMRSLPMDIALMVGFFLTSIVNISINTLKSSEVQESSRQDKKLKSISKRMAG